jgi:cytochrome c biogenesis protein CcdA
MSEVINLTRLTLLALADSVNPCAIAVLTMVLMAILIQNPKNRKKVLYAGIGFTLSVFIGYLFYGVVLVSVFKSFTILLRENSFYIYKGLAIIAMIIGALHIKDYVYYKKAGFATEMPARFRPRVKKIINKITSPFGAFITGFLVSIFLLPCTIGPYIVASGLLAELNFFKVFLWLLYYNLIFVLPMIIITGIVYYGFAKIGEVSGWKEKHIKLLHLIAGILMFAVGFALLIGWL